MNDFFKKIISLLNANMKSIITPTAVLLSICIVVTLALSATNAITEKRIENINEENQKNAMSRIIKADNYEKNIYNFNGDETTYHIAVKNGKAIGYIFTVSESGYGGEVKVMTAVNPDGTVKAVDILDASNETPGLGQNITKENFYSQFAKKSSGISVVKNGANGDNNEINAVTGATISSSAVTRAVNKSLKYAKQIIKNNSSNDTEQKDDDDEDIVDEDVSADDITQETEVPDNEQQVF